MTHRFISICLISTALAGGLSACGGGGDAATVTSNEPPLSASASDAGLVAYTASVAEAPADPAPAEPVDLSNFTPPPTTETDDPVATSADEVI